MRSVRPRRRAGLVSSYAPYIRRLGDFYREFNGADCAADGIEQDGPGGPCFGANESQDGGQTEAGNNDTKNVDTHRQSGGEKQIEIEIRKSASNRPEARAENARRCQ
jgi:hypothetical protein